jgi:hypothetical protein
LPTAPDQGIRLYWLHEVWMTAFVRFRSLNFRRHMRLRMHRLQRVAASASPILFAGTVALVLALSSIGKVLTLNSLFVWAFLVLSIVPES